MSLRADHKKWADLVIAGTDPVQACLQVYPKISLKTAQNKSGLIGKIEEVREYISNTSKKIHETVTNKLVDELSTSVTGIILTSAKKREILAQIANREIETEKIVIIKGKPSKIKSKPDFSEIMKAIELDNKMAGDMVKPKDNQAAKAEKVTKVVVVEDQTKPPVNGRNSSNK